MRVQVISLSAVTLAVGIVFADDSKASPPRTALPLSTNDCYAFIQQKLCCLPQRPARFRRPESGVPSQLRHPLMNHREEWERILQKIRTGEMPPKGMPRRRLPKSTHS